MKAALITRYSSTDSTFDLTEVPIPTPQPGQALVRVLAAGVNPVDGMIARGEVKLITPYRLPQIAGNEIVGVIESLPAPLSGFAVGDRVCARLPLDAIGAFAEYVAVDGAALAHVPDTFTTVEAAAIPLTALTTMQALDLMDARPGQSLFISGGTGGVGAMAIPLATAAGLHVSTNGAAANKQRVLDLGAEEFFDYRTQDYTQHLRGIDHVLDTVGGNETVRQMGIVRPGGTLISLRAMPTAALARRLGLPLWKQGLFGLASRKFTSLARRHQITYDFVYVTSNGTQLAQALEILANRGVKPPVDTVYPFAQVNEAMAKVSQGGARGKIIVSFES